MTALSLPRAAERSESLLSRIVRYLRVCREVYAEALEMQRKMTGRFAE